MCRPFSQDPEYIAQRRTLRRFQYNLRRRAEALIRCLQEQDVPPGGLVLDIGTADGLVLRDLVEAWPCRA
ncbi:MAG: hypothetical protein JXA37_01955, partial [Chloroflexia bacterium]|nr:hypothetical protein [Chloroflexia bacterium]